MRDGTAEPVSRNQILRHARGQGSVHFPCSADHEQDWQPYPVDPYSAICDDHTYIFDPPLGGSMRVAMNDSDDRAGLRGYVQFNKYTYIHTYIHTVQHIMLLTASSLVALPPQRLRPAGPAAALPPSSPTSVVERPFDVASAIGLEPSTSLQPSKISLLNAHQRYNVAAKVGSSSLSLVRVQEGDFRWLKRRRWLKSYC